MERRRFIKHSSAASILPLLPRTAWAESSPKAGDLGRLVIIVVNQGLDQQYFFDSRPQEMVAAGLVSDQIYGSGDGITMPEVQSLMKQGAQQVLFANGNKTWVHPTTVNLLKHQRDLAIVNGVIGLPGNDSHDDNLRYMLSGLEANGPTFVDGLSSLTRDSVFTTINGGEEFLPVNDSGATLRIGINNFLDGMRLLGSRGANFERSRSAQFLKTHVQENTPYGRALRQSFTLPIRMAKPRIIQPQNGETEVNVNFAESSPSEVLDFIGSCFEWDLTRVVRVVLGDSTIDCHDLGAANMMPQLAYNLSTFLAELISGAKRFPLSQEQNRTLFDQTTFVVMSEFSRTNYRIESGEIQNVQASGTDHNPYGGSAYFFGRKIKGDVLVGSTDCQWEQTKVDTPLNVASEFGKRSGSNRMVGLARPKEFQSADPRNGSLKMGVPIFAKAPEQRLRLSNYITGKSIVNTIWNLFGVTEDRHLKFNEDDKLVNAPVLKEIIL